MSIYKHKQQLFYKISKEQLTSRYLVACPFEKLDETTIELKRIGNELKVKYIHQAMWIALITDDGFQLKYDKSQVTFTLHNEAPLMLLIGISNTKVLSLSLSKK